MTRELRAISATDPLEVFAALRDALTGDGPAIMPYDATTPDPLFSHRVPQRIALVVQTSGSSGSPKRVALSTDALLSSASAAETVLGGPGQWLLALPAHYIAGINVLTRSLTSQTEPVIMPPGHFAPDVFLEAARKMDSSLRFTSLVPAQLARLLEVGGALEADERALELEPERALEPALELKPTSELEPTSALETLRRFDRILVGGQAMPVQLLATALELGLNITRTYGSSETGGGCIYDGIPIGDTRIRIVDGQVELAGSVLADGYLGDNYFADDERTATAFHVDDGFRWYRTQDTGDLCTDAHGNRVVHVTGRVDDIIISGGLKVSLAAIERVVNNLPGLENAVIVTAPSPQWGEVPVLITDRSCASAVDLDNVQNVVATVLGPAARPVRLITIDRMPRLASGKPDRHALRALARP